MDTILLRQLRTIAYILATMTALYAYSMMWGVRSGDWELYFSPYISHMKNPQAGLHPLGAAYGNSTPAFTLVLYLVSKLPFTPLYLFKFCTFLFVCISAFLASRFVRGLGCGENRALVAYGLFLSFPSAWMNSAAWGQSDAIYTCFLLAALHCMSSRARISRFIGNESLAILMTGVAFSFKLQSIFFVIALIYYLVTVPRARKAIWLLPIPYLLTALPLALAGLPWLRIFSTYLRQTNNYRHLFLAAPNVWSLFPALHYDTWSWIGIFSAAAVVAMGSLFFLCYPPPPCPINNARVAFLSCLLIPYLLPCMCERYFYPAEMFGMLLAFSDRRYLFVAAATCAISSLSYTTYFHFLKCISFSVSTSTLGVAMTALVMISVAQVGGRLFKDGLEEAMDLRAQSFLERRGEAA